MDSGFVQVYLKFEHDFGDPARIQILYERALAEFPVSSDLWFDYTQYLDKTFKVFFSPFCTFRLLFCPSNILITHFNWAYLIAQTSRIVRDAYYRATRNCPWIGELWVRYLLSLERSNSSEEELSTVCFHLYVAFNFFTSLLTISDLLLLTFFLVIFLSLLTLCFAF